LFACKITSQAPDDVLKIDSTHDNIIKMDVNRIILMIILMMLATNYLYNDSTCSVMTWATVIFVQLCMSILLIICVTFEIENRVNLDEFKLCCFDVLRWTTIIVSFLSFLRQIWYCSFSLSTLLISATIGGSQWVISWCIINGLAESMGI